MRQRLRRVVQMSAATQVRVLVLVLLVLIPAVVATALVVARGEQRNVRQLTLALGPAYQHNSEALLAMTQAQAAWHAAMDGATGGEAADWGAREPQVDALLRAVRDDLDRDEISDDDQARYAVLLDRERGAVRAWFAAAAAAEPASGGSAAARQAAGTPALEKFAEFDEANQTLASALDEDRQVARTLSRASVWVVAAVAVAGCLLALLIVFFGGRLVTASMVEPLVHLRAVVRRQRDGDRVVRADEHTGSSEIRALAADYNELVRSRQLLQEEQAQMLLIHQLTLDVARRVRSVDQIAEALELVCASLGTGLALDRVLLYTVDDGGAVEGSAQWHRDDLPPLPPLPPSLMGQVAAVNDELRREATVFRLPDMLDPAVRDEPRVAAYHRATGARALLMVPVGVGERGLGVLALMTVELPRRWRRYEIQGVQQCVSYIAQGIVSARLVQMQDEQVTRLTALDRQKTDFMATVSHELRTPLTSISGYLELLEDGDYGRLTEPQLGALGVIGRNTARLRGLIEDLLVLNKIETSGLHAKPEDVTLAEIVHDVVEVLRPAAANGDIELVVDPPDADLCVHVDRAHFERALINLGSNAVKFTPAGGQVRISADSSGDRIAISVTDTGIGIPHDDLERLGSRFFRASNATAQAIPGTGLGLAIVRTIVEGHGGQMFVASSEGEGTTVRVFLPAARAASVAPQ